MPHCLEPSNVRWSSCFYKSHHEVPAGLSYSERPTKITLMVAIQYLWKCPGSRCFSETGVSKRGKFVSWWFTKIPPPLFRAELRAYGSSQARGRIRAIAAGPKMWGKKNTTTTPQQQQRWICRPTPQLTAMLDP